MKFPRQRLLAATVVAVLAAGGCSGSSLGEDSDASSGPVKIGLIVPKTGPYKAVGDDLTAGFKLYLDSQKGRLGGRSVEVVEADEGNGGEPARAAAKKLLDQDRVIAIVGGATADTTATLYPLVTQARVPFIGTGGRPDPIAKVDDKPVRPDYIWHTSWMSNETGAAIADHIRTTVDGPVYAIGPDYSGGHDQVGGFAKAFTAAGGQLANTDGKVAWTPWSPPTTNFEPFLTRIKSSGAKAVYTFYAGTSAAEFVKQYKQFGVNLPLYGAGFLTEGDPILKAQGAAAEGIYTCLNYASTLDVEANREFVRRFQAAHNGAGTNIYHVTGWDAGLVLDKALAEAAANPDAPAATSEQSQSHSATSVVPAASNTASAGAPPVPVGGGTTSGGINSAALNAAISRVGGIDSPRGPWQFGTRNHTPVQRWYLRQVRLDGGQLANVVLDEVATLGT